jgi:type II secretory ATPase GspE/PulE/Tfp pilus assembly ATPase PilB-like protein
MDGINQMQVNTAVGLTFASGLRSILRQDPNVVMVGEIRDQETAGLAVQAALTGHLVLSTLHTNSAAGVLPRFLDMGIEPFLVASTVNTCIGQRLVRRICEKCKYSEPASQTAVDLINRSVANI